MNMIFWMSKLPVDVLSSKVLAKSNLLEMFSVVSEECFPRLLCFNIVLSFAPDKLANGFF